MDAQMWAIWSLWNTQLYSGETLIALSTIERLARAVGRIGDPFGQLMVDRLHGYALQYGGNQVEARRLTERVLENSGEPSNRFNAFCHHVDQQVFARAVLARARLLLGYPDQAIAQAQASLAEAQATGYIWSICETLRLGLCPVAVLAGDLETAQSAVAMLVDLATSNNGPFWRLTGRCLEAKLLIRQGSFAAGTALLRGQLDAAEKVGWAIWQPELLGALAEGLAGLGRLPEAIATVDQALAKADRDGERNHVPELYRIKGGILLREAEAAAEHCFATALEIARDQGALFWELRVACDLARLRIGQDRRQEARAVLEPVYRRFTEGSGLPDLQAAERLLAG